LDVGDEGGELPKLKLRFELDAETIGVGIIVIDGRPL
jgi:hypothetical protein